MMQNTYIRGLSARVEEVETEREGLSKRLRALKEEAEETGVRWDAFMLAHKIRKKLNDEAQAHWRRTFEESAGQLGLFAEEEPSA